MPKSINFDDLFVLKDHKVPPCLDEGDSPPDNNDRAEWAKSALNHFGVECGIKPQYDGWPMVIYDLLCDIAHFCDRNSISLGSCIEHAKDMYDDETEGQGTQFEVPHIYKVYRKERVYKPQVDRCDKAMELLKQIAAAKTTDELSVGPTNTEYLAKLTRGRDFWIVGARTIQEMPK